MRQHVSTQNKDESKKAYYHQLFDAYLKKCGLRQTRQRKIILDAVFSSGQHVDTETIANQAKKIDKTIGIATVYRTLKMMTEAGVLIEHKFGERAQFEFIDTENEHHDHLICNQCGKIFEFFDAEIESLQEKISEKMGFVLKKHRMELFADCVSGNDCKKRISK